MHQTKQTILAYNHPTPRYTSYPPATCFTPTTDATAYVASLEQHATQVPASLYVHIPFCTKLCYYCGCLTYATKRPERVDRYLHSLHQEATLVASRLPLGMSVEHVHFGGGSPTMLTPPQFEQLMRHLRQLFSISVDAEIAIEADPRQMSEAKMANYAKMGVTRLSLGVQDIDPLVMKTINREQPLRLTVDAMQLARGYGITDINIDLMYGLPHQTLASQRHTIDIITGLAPTRIAFFGYAHVPWMKKHMKAVDLSALPDGSLRYDLYTQGRDMLLEAGYEAVGIDHFVSPMDPMYQALREGRLHRNFQGYTTDTAPLLIGLGASAISETPDLYAQNAPDVKQYEEAIAMGNFPTYRMRSKTSDDIWTQEIIKALMCYHRVDLAEVRHKFHLPASLFARALERLAPLEAQGIILRQDETITVAPHALLLTRLVASAFDAYTPWALDSTTPQRHAHSV